MNSAGFGGCVRRVGAWLCCMPVLCALVVGPLQHHDLLCHVRSPVHCSACTSALSTLQTTSHAPCPPTALADAGRAARTVAEPRSLATPSSVADRAPPAA